jgi:hypothetical protein
MAWILDRLTLRQLSAIQTLDKPCFQMSIVTGLYIWIYYTCFLILGHYHVDSYRWWLQVITQLKTCHYTKWYIRYGKSDPCVAYLHQLFLMSCLCPRDEAAFLWSVVYHCWPIIHSRWVLWIYCKLIFFAARWTVTNWSSLEVAYGIDKSMCKQTFSTLARIKLIWIIESLWNICIIRNLPTSNLNKERSNEILVGTEIWTSHFWDHRWAGYHSAMPPPCQTHY